MANRFDQDQAYNRLAEISQTGRRDGKLATSAEHSITRFNNVSTGGQIAEQSNARPSYANISAGGKINEKQDRATCQELTLILPKDLVPYQNFKPYDLYNLLLANKVKSTDIGKLCQSFDRNFEIGFRNQEVYETLRDRGLRFGSRMVDLVEKVRRVTHVSILNLDDRCPEEKIVQFMQQYGEIDKVIYHKYNFGYQLFSGKILVHLKFFENAYIPRLSEIDGFRCFVIYTGQPETCNVCNSSNHLRKDCPDLKCRNCDEIGHFSRSCPKSPRCKQCNVCHEGNCREKDLVEKAMRYVSEKQKQQQDTVLDDLEMSEDSMSDIGAASEEELGGSDDSVEESGTRKADHDGVVFQRKGKPSEVGQGGGSSHGEEEASDLGQGSRREVSHATGKEKESEDSGRREPSNESEKSLATEQESIRGEVERKDSGSRRKVGKVDVKYPESLPARSLKECRTDWASDVENFYEPEQPAKEPQKRHVESSPETVATKEEQVSFKRKQRKKNRL